MQKEKAAEINALLAGSAPEDVLRYFLLDFQGRTALSSSLGPEDQILTEMISHIHPSARIFTLDTGRLFPETYDLMHLTNQRYKTRIEVFFPPAAEVERMVADKGINLFYESIENRKECCHIRKILPLKRALQGLDAWITGLRREQSPTRDEVEVVEWDEANQIIKVSPLINWSREQVWDYINAKHIPVNPLHQKGFASIGCQPCTRAINENEDERAGRWWWENPETKECGLHKKV